MTYQKTSQKNLRKTSKKLKFLEVPSRFLEVPYNTLHAVPFNIERLHRKYLKRVLLRMFNGVSLD